MSPTGRSASQEPRADVELRLPADSAYVSVLRTTSAALAARLDFTIDDIEDLRMSVSEASAIVLPQADPGSDLTCGFRLQPGHLTVAISVPSRSPQPVDEDSFAWQVLSTLTSDVAARAGSGSFVLTLTVHAQHLDLDD